MTTATEILGFVGVTPDAGLPVGNPVANELHVVVGRGACGQFLLPAPLMVCKDAGSRIR